MRCGHGYDVNSWTNLLFFVLIFHHISCPLVGRCFRSCRFGKVCETFNSLSWWWPWRSSKCQYVSLWLYHNYLCHTGWCLFLHCIFFCCRNPLLCSYWWGRRYLNRFVCAVFFFNMLWGSESTALFRKEKCLWWWCLTLAVPISFGYSCCQDSFEFGQTASVQLW